jgi:hypothetical protein
MQTRLLTLWVVVQIVASLLPSWQLETGHKRNKKASFIALGSFNLREYSFIPPPLLSLSLSLFSPYLPPLIGRLVRGDILENDARR